MRLFIAGLFTETNVFSPLPAGRRAFDDCGVFFGDATAHADAAYSAPLKVWRNRGEAIGAEVVESVLASARPAGRVVRSVYEGFRDKILEDLKNAGPIDIVLLHLHGAMAAEGCDDCEGDLLQRARTIVGPKAVIGAELDPHCHLTPAMTDASDILVFYKEYPHTDTIPRAQELFSLCYRTLRGQIKPALAVHDCEMIGLWPTTEPAMRRLVDDMVAAEAAEEALSLSLVHGFPYADMPDMGAKALAVAETQDAAEAAATKFGGAFRQLKEGVSGRFVSVDEALTRVAVASETPIVLADAADNPGGGAPGDSTFLLVDVVKRGLSGVAVAYLYDPIAVRLCVEAGMGARLPLRIGGKLGPASGAPVDTRVTVRAIAHDVRQKFGDELEGTGTVVWAACEGGVDVVLCDKRVQTFDPGPLTAMGLDLNAMRAVIVKSTTHFHHRFAPLAKDVIYVNTPGALRFDFENMPYKTVTRPLWPWRKS